MIPWLSGSGDGIVEIQFTIKHSKQMVKQLTLQIAAAYLGATVKTKEGLHGTLVGVFKPHNSLNIELGDGSISIGHIISDCNLVLPHISSITNEDAIEVAKILIPQCFQRRTKGWIVSRDFTITGYPYIKIHHQMIAYTVQIDPTLVNFDVDNMEDRETGGHDMKPVSIIDFLRPKYDCGHGDITSLIKAGIAINQGENLERSVATDTQPESENSAT